MCYEATGSSASIFLDGMMLERKRFVVHLVEISAQRAVWS